MAGEIASIYDRILKYEIVCKCREPLHVGGRNGQREILTRSTDGKPFIQATGIAGAFRDFFSEKPDIQGELFGCLGHEGGENSRIRFSDGEFLTSSVCTELRPHVRLNDETGTTRNAAAVSSNRIKSRKFDIETVAAGASFCFQVYIFEKEKKLGASFENALHALHLGQIQFGGQKSNGCGYMSLSSVKKSCYDMYQKKDRELWVKEEKRQEDITGFLVRPDYTGDTRLRFELSAETEGPVLVKPVGTTQYGGGSWTVGNIQNHKNEYILPASSIKGVVRNQMGKILRYKELNPDFIKRIFGTHAERKDTGIIGNICFFDCVVGNKEENDKVQPQRRFHINKFTGGIMPSELRFAKPVFGEVNIRVDLRKDRDKRENALLLLALRDLGLGICPLGDGNGIGRGFLKGKKLKIQKERELLAEIDFRTGKVIRGKELIEEYLSALH